MNQEISILHKLIGNRIVDAVLNKGKGFSQLSPIANLADGITYIFN